MSNQRFELTSSEKRHTLQSVPGSSEKVDPGPLEKADAIPKFTVWVKNSFLTNSRVLTSNATIVFEDSSPNIRKY